MMSNLPLEILLFFHKWYLYLYLMVSVIISIHKTHSLYFPPSTLDWEITMLVFLLILEHIRLSTASYANKTCDQQLILRSLVLGLLGVLGHTFFVRMQTWVLGVDIVINSIALGLVCLEILLSAYMLIA